MKYSKLNLGQIEAIINKLGGEEGVQRFLSGKTYVTERKFSVWKTIKLGLHKTKEEYFSALKESKVTLIVGVKEAIETENFSISQTVREINLVAVCPHHLGFFETTTVAEFHKRAISLGLSLCPPEVALALRLEYLQQPIKGVEGNLTIAMEPIAAEPGYSETFQLRVNHDGAYISTCNYDLETDISLEYQDTERYIFVI
jgi:hypothetical protein